MGAKYSIEARNIDDTVWPYYWQGDSIVKFIAKSIYVLTHYEVCLIGKHGY